MATKNRKASGSPVTTPLRGRSRSNSTLTEEISIDVGSKVIVKPSPDATPLPETKAHLIGQIGEVLELRGGSWAKVVFGRGTRGTEHSLRRGWLQLVSEVETIPLTAIHEENISEENQDLSATPATISRRPKNQALKKTDAKDENTHDLEVAAVADIKPTTASKQKKSRQILAAEETINEIEEATVADQTPTKDSKRKKNHQIQAEDAKEETINEIEGATVADETPTKVSKQKKSHQIQAAEETTNEIEGATVADQSPTKVSKQKKSHQTQAADAKEETINEIEGATVADQTPTKVSKQKQSHQTQAADANEETINESEVATVADQTPTKVSKQKKSHQTAADANEETINEIEGATVADQTPPKVSKQKKSYQMQAPDAKEETINEIEVAIAAEQTPTKDSKRKKSHQTQAADIKEENINKIEVATVADQTPTKDSKRKKSHQIQEADATEENINENEVAAVAVLTPATDSKRKKSHQIQAADAKEENINELELAKVVDEAPTTDSKRKKSHQKQVADAKENINELEVAKVVDEAPTTDSKRKKSHQKQVADAKEENINKLEVAEVVDEAPTTDSKRKKSHQKQVADEETSLVIFDEHSVQGNPVIDYPKGAKQELIPHEDTGTSLKDSSAEIESEEELDLDTLIDIAIARVSKKTNKKAGHGELIRGGLKSTSVLPRKKRRQLDKDTFSKLYSDEGEVAAQSLLSKSFLYKGNISDCAPPLKRPKEKKPVTAGKNWFEMAQTKMTPELQKDVQAIKLRGYLDPSRFYKAPEINTDFLQVGRVVEGRGEFFSARIPKKQRKQNIVEEILADERIRKYSKKKVKEIQSMKGAGKKSFYRKKMNKRQQKWGQS